MGPTALFERVGDDRLAATQLAVGPWSPDALHGGPVAALLAGALERAVLEAGLGVPFHPARLTVELLRPVSRHPVSVRARLRRPGRRVCVADAELLDEGGTPLATATLGCIRRQLVDGAGDIDPPPPPPDQGVGLASETLDGPTAFHRSGVEHSLVVGTFEQVGPAVDWIRLLQPVVEGEAVTPLQRVAAAADFGNGVSRRFPMEEVTFINPDLSVFLHREPVGEWICLDARTTLGEAGFGVAESVLYDRRGAIGRAVQTLFVEGR